jgi:hypothetical protein
MDEVKARRYRQDIEALVIAENVKLPTCPSDGKPCNVPDMSCSVYAFGSFASDGNEEVVWSCPRLKKALRSF